MPRKAHIDAPGALHHIIICGIKRQKIFSGDHDRDDLVERFGTIITGTQAFCFTRAFLFINSFPNGFILRITLKAWFLLHTEHQS
jgi:hypothetical protein